MNLSQWLVEMAQKQASDLFVTVDAPPMVNIEGRMSALSDEVIDKETAKALVNQREVGIDTHSGAGPGAH